MDELERLRQRNRDLSEQVGELEEQVRQLRAMLTPQVELPAWMPRLSGIERSIILTLLARPFVPYEAMLNAVWPMGEGRDGAEPDVKTLAVYVTRLRRKVEGHGIIINGVWGRGLEMAQQSRDLLNPGFTSAGASSLHNNGGDDGSKERAAAG